MTTISVITATYNSEQKIASLIASLASQTDTDFEWVVVDGASSDQTLAMVRSAGLARTVVISEPDFGIYDALNKGVRAASGDYYLVLGSDDVLDKGGIANFRAALVDGPADIVTAGVRCDSGILRPVTGKGWLYGMRGYVSAHSVGTLIRRRLHEEHGYYSRKFPIAADHCFIKSVAGAGARIKVCDFTAGNFGDGGVSTSDVVGTHSEFFRVQLITGEGRLTQLLIYFLRLLKNFRKL